MFFIIAFFIIYSKSKKDKAENWRVNVIMCREGIGCGDGEGSYQVIASILSIGMMAFLAIFSGTFIS